MGSPASFPSEFIAHRKQDVIDRLSRVSPGVCTSRLPGRRCSLPVLIGHTPDNLPIVSNAAHLEEGEVARLELGTKSRLSHLPAAYDAANAVDKHGVGHLKRCRADQLQQLHFDNHRRRSTVNRPSPARRPTRPGPWIFAAGLESVAAPRGADKVPPRKGQLSCEVVIRRHAAVCTEAKSS